jgi:phytoene dehydrogenase-like protein
MHAVIAQHYARGGYYPVGGAGTIATSILPIIESAGGACLLNHKAQEVLIKGGKVAEVAFYAPVVISDAGAYLTYAKLLAGEPRIKPAAAGSGFLQDSASSKGLLETSRAIIIGPGAAANSVRCRVESAHAPEEGGRALREKRVFAVK